jgi:hypothetical protein
MSELTNRLRKGFDFLCREKQIDSYQAISNEAADEIDGLEAENLKFIEEYTITGVILMKREAERSILDILNSLEVNTTLSVGSIEFFKSQYIGDMASTVAAVEIELEFK